MNEDEPKPKPTPKGLQNLDVALTFGLGIAGVCFNAQHSIPLAAGVAVLTFVGCAITAQKK